MQLQEIDKLTKDNIELKEVLKQTQSQLINEVKAHKKTKKAIEFQKIG